LHASCGPRRKVRNVRAMPSKAPWTFIVALTLTIGLSVTSSGCAGGNGAPQSPPPSVSVTVAPSTASVLLGASTQFTSTVTGTDNKTVSWAVNGMAGGSPSVGTIDATGLYTAPTDLPNSPSVSISATSQADSTASGKSPVTITSDIVIAVATNPTLILNVATNSALSLAVSITSQGKPDQHVTWSVNGITGGNSTVGTITPTGTGAATFQAPANVPNPFTLTIAATSIADSTKTASLPMIVAGTIASATQTITAAAGGTITLPDGSSVTIPPNALAMDQSVTLSELSVMPNQPPNQLIFSAGSVLEVSLTSPNPASAISKRHLRDPENISSAGNGLAAPNMVFSVYQQSTSTGLNGSIGIVDLVDTKGNPTFAPIAYNASSTTPFASFSLNASWLSGIDSEVQSVAVGAVNTVSQIANNLYTGFVYTLPARRCWDPTQLSNPHWSDYSSCSSNLSGKSVLVMVHGMLSCVNQMVGPTSGTSLQPIPYDFVVGFDYDWTQHLTDSGQQLTSLLNDLEQKGVRKVDILAHSEGVPVSILGAAGVSDKSRIQNFVGLAGPLEGTPVASDDSALLQFVLIGDTGIEDLSSDPGGACSAWATTDLKSLIQKPFKTDLQEMSVTVTQDVPQAAGKLVNTRIFLAGGYDPGRLGTLYVLDTLAGIVPPFFSLVSKPNDGVVGLDSALAFSAGFTVHPLPPYNLFHTALPQDAKVITDVTNQLSHSSSPQLLCLSPKSPCGGAQDSLFTFTGTGFGPSAADVQVLSQDSTGTVTPLVEASLSDSSGTIDWTVMPTCSGAVGLFSIFTFDQSEGLASNNVMQEIDPCGATNNPVPTLASVTPSSVPLGSFTLTLNGTNFVAGSQVLFGSTVLTTQFVSSMQLTAAGTATTAQTGNVPITISNPAPGGGASNAISVTVVNTGNSSSGSTGIITGTVNGQTVDLAYIPQPNTSTVAVVNVDSASSTGALIATIAMPINFQPNATAANAVTSQVIVISYYSPAIQVIDATQNKIVASYTAPVTQVANYSGGGCQICGAVIDSTTGKAILDTAQGTILLDLNSGQFSTPYLNLAAENFAYNPNTKIALLPTYGQSSFVGLQSLNLATGAVSQLSSSVGVEPDSAAIDIVTNLAVIPDENTATQYLVNMQQASYSGNTFTAPVTSFPINAPPCQIFWTLASIENVSHILFLGTEFDGCVGVAMLPSTTVTGPPSMPAPFAWGKVLTSPDGVPWNNGGDPHGIAVFTSVVDGKSYGFLVDSAGPWVAKVDLKGLSTAAALSGGYPGQVDPSPSVVFLKTQ
jgi:hypothetical protein